MKITLDWKKYEATAIQAIAEGCVLLKNENEVLPLKKDTTVSVFGRIQSSYYKSGTGSGGKVNVSKVYNIVEGLEESGLVKVNQDLKKIYSEWEKDHPYDEGLGWGKERWSQDEMPLTKEIIEQAAKVSDSAIVIIGRTAGEDKDNSATEGSYLLSKDEMEMLKAVRSGFSKMIVLLNVGNIIDMSFIENTNPDAVMYVWQGGMLGGIGTAQVLTGQVSPCGKLTDTIAKNIQDYPSTKNFGRFEGNDYQEDIYVGYRYFETFAKDKVLYPFGFGLSYTDFSITCKKAEADQNNKVLNIEIEVKNTGKTFGKEVVQIYINAADGVLGTADKALIDFGKTHLLKSGETTILNFAIPFENFASYDDSGKTGHKSTWLLEAGKYTVYAGNDVRSAQEIFAFEILELIEFKKCEEAYMPVKSFDRFTKNNGQLAMEATPLSTISQDKRRLERLPKEITQVSSTNLKLKDVYEKKSSMTEFVSQLSHEDLACLVRGEGMGSSLVTPGTASAYGGVSPRLRETFGIPVACCDDGPSGMRLDCGIKAFSLPNGTSLACTFNTELVKELYSFTGLEMCNNKVENLLGPGMNIHRNPLNGRNFEYFSEDPLLTGAMGTAMLKGLQQSGVTGTIKHFCGNNQEMNRYGQDSVISERALREIYLKGFEIAVKNGADSVMTTYGKVNGKYTASAYDLNTTILREDWGFNGIVMNDWWAYIDGDGENAEPDKTNFAAMIRAQNDLYMCCPDGKTNASGDNTLEALKDGRLTRGELQRSAINICEQLLNTQAFARTLGTQNQIEIINRPKEADDINLDDIETTILTENNDFDLTFQESKNNTNYVFSFDVQKVGTYEVTVTADSDMNNPLAQLPCTIYYSGIPSASFTFTGTSGTEQVITKKLVLPQRFAVLKLTCNCNGLKLKNINFKFISDSIKFTDLVKFFV